MKVSKFGGSSVANSEQIKKVLNIINSDDERKIVVVSAPGKRFKEDVKTTDLLIRLYDKVINKLDYSNKLRQIIERYEEIVKELEMDYSILDELKNDLVCLIDTYNNQPERLLDALKSCGEDFNARIIAQYNNQLGFPTRYLSPKEAGIIVTDEPGNAMILESSYEQIYQLRQYDETLIIPGFFGYSENNDIVTFPRGGSDITGAILARGIKASLYENFTDVSGIFRANPTVVSQPEVIPEITYREMRELSYAGFGVFHDEALEPLYKDRIPVVIKNTNRPTDTGTYIVSERDVSNLSQIVSGVSCDKGFTIINVKKYLMNREVGFTRKILSILEDENISIEHIPSGIDNLSIIMRTTQIHGKEERVLNKIREQIKVDELTIDYDLAILMIVGEGMNKAIGTAAGAAAALSKNKINLNMINQGSSEISMMFGIDQQYSDIAVQAIYNEYFVKETTQII
ncbi:MULTISPECIES: aspartate kinase [Mammaliicoccus]|uniref:Aspartokinase n=1 Tax=Mammaliicoccus fleurettii TaxID=150056 RepID=A0ABS5MQP8_9STAP|nr:MULTISPECIES: aspartate kinase [Mammaliicoccus]HCN59643.1 aspartate kinase [Staphylococcus sp.]MBL0848109.1 aspartate kinase [Mammaliicoccus fleurettii]MBO3062655.1 aspartate kinase [Mammaliicoccus fleurettii]MBS3672821.1 aspartate kinase [Mammaliicoccus fleurettii]MBS3697967.1 aspartate kinase [Mammaliicoccus fleurettii]